MTFWEKNLAVLQTKQPECVRWVLDGLACLRKQETIILPGALYSGTLYG